MRCLYVGVSQFPKAASIRSVVIANASLRVKSNKSAYRAATVTSDPPPAVLRRWDERERRRGRREKAKGKSEEGLRKEGSRKGKKGGGKKGGEKEEVKGEKGRREKGRREEGRRKNERRRKRCTASNVPTVPCSSTTSPNRVHIAMAVRQSSSFTAESIERVFAPPYKANNAVLRHATSLLS